MSTSVVTVTYNAGPALTRCLDSFADQLSGNDEVLVVNTGDPGFEVDDAGARQRVTVIRPEGGNVGYAAGSNLGAERARGDVFVFLNPDTIVAPGALVELARAVADDTVGIA
ncbi:MAG: glycosyltransferase family 2 protein, partial [Gaiellaceae bacterium]